MRVLVLSTRYPPEHAGGYELQCAGSVRDLRRHGHTVRVLTSGPPAAVAERGVHRELHRFAAPPAAGTEREAVRGEHRNRAALDRHLEDFRPDVVAFWRLAELSMSLVERVRVAGVPSVGMVCDTWMLDGPVRDPWARRHGWRPSFADGRWLFVSEALRRTVLDAGVELGPSVVVPAGIEMPVPAEPPPRRPWRGRVLYAGRLSPLKGVDVAVRAAALLPPGTTLTVVGAGPSAFEAELRDLAGGSPRVAFAGARPHAEMPASYADADVLVFPSVWAEPWGLVPLEAMAAGTPVVATGTGGSAEYLRDGANCLVVAPGDPVALAAAVRRLCADAELRAALARGGRDTARRHPAAASHAAVRGALEHAAASRVGAAAPARTPTVTA